MPPNPTLLRSRASLRADYGGYDLRMISHLP